MSSEVVLSEIPPLEKFKSSLAAIEGKDEIGNALAMTDAAIAYAKVTKSVELMNDAVELRLWTERRAGQIVYLDDPAETASQLRTRSPIVKRWRLFASIEEDSFSSSILSIRASRDLSIVGMFEHIVMWFGRDVASGVRKLPDGRYRISWKTLEGEKKSKTMDGPLYNAKEMRAHYVYRENERKIVRKSKTWKRLDVAYGRVRRLLSELDAMTTSLDKHTKESVNAAVSALHQAEDNLSQAMESEVANALFEKREEERKEVLRRAETHGTGA